MPDYQKMYHTLFNKMTDIIDELQEVQRQTEEMYINADKTAIELAPTDDAQDERVLTSLHG